MAESALVAVSDDGDEIRCPQVPPILKAAAQPAPAAQVNAAWLKALRSNDYAEREAAVANLVGVGQPALAALRKLAQERDSEVVWWARAAIQQIERQAPHPRSCTPEELFALSVKGPTPDVLATLRALPSVDAATLLDMHIRLEIGMDCIYSMRPRQVLPQALRLLRLQQEPFYQTLLLRLIRNVLERAILPLPGTPEAEDARAGIKFVEANPDLIAAVRPFLTHPKSLLRREAVLIMAWSQVNLKPGEIARLLKDQAPETARTAQVLRAVLRSDIQNSLNPEVVAWIGECLKALGQDKDRLAQLGAFYALRELLLDYPAEMDQALASLTQGRPKDALTWLMAGDPAGRMLLMRRGSLRFPEAPPSSLVAVLALRDFDLLRKEEPDWTGRYPGEMRCLSWRNLVNDSDSDIRASTGGAEFNRPENWPGLVEFEPWYQACARSALSPHLSVAVGAIRGLMVSDVAGARALVMNYAASVQSLPDMTAVCSLPRDLIVLHPCIGRLNQAELPPALRTLWQARAFKRVSIGRTNGSNPPVAPMHTPLALWGFLMQNDCNYINPVGRFLDGQLTVRHLPLLLAFLEYNPRVTIFMAELDAAAAAPAIRREVLSRRKEYHCSYDNDLFRGVARFAILNATPVLETYAKQNRNWPLHGVVTIAGCDDSSCYYWEWTNRFVPGKPSPLAAGVLREFIGCVKAGRAPTAWMNTKAQIVACSEKGLLLMGVTEKMSAEK